MFLKGDTQLNREKFLEFVSQLMLLQLYSAL